jgi:hypothetical protein
MTVILGVSRVDCHLSGEVARAVGVSKVGTNRVLHPISPNKAPRTVYRRPLARMPWPIRFDRLSHKPGSHCLV